MRTQEQGKVFIKAHAEEESDFIYQLKDGFGDASDFSIDESTGQVTLLIDPNYETKSGYDFTIVAVDSLGNVAEKAIVIPIRDVVEVPATPQQMLLSLSSDSGISTADNITNDTTPVLIGSASADSTIEIFASDIFLGRTTTDASGNWSFSISGEDYLDDAEYSVTAKAINRSGSVYVDRDEIGGSFPGHTAYESRNKRAFAALLDDGSVVTWGDPKYGGNVDSIASVLDADVTQIFSSSSGFLALKADNSLVLWGDGFTDENNSFVEIQLQSGAAQIATNDYSFALVQENGALVSDELQLAFGAEKVFATKSAFAVLRDNGSVVAWGDPESGGDSTSVGLELLAGVTNIFPSKNAFAALKEDGSVVTWGASDYGGDSSTIRSELLSGVTQIFTTGSAFAALKEDGSVVTWGSSASGGDSSSTGFVLQSGVEQIFSTGSAFAALKEDGSVVTWGDSVHGGDSSAIATHQNSPFIKIFATETAFAGLTEDGSVFGLKNGIMVVILVMLHQS